MLLIGSQSGVVILFLKETNMDEEDKQDGAMRILFIRSADFVPGAARGNAL
jgi:hypothetical protein